MFETYTLTWDSKEFHISPADRLRAIAVVEEHYPIMTLGQAVANQRLNLARLAEAVAALLRFVAPVDHAKTTAESVYTELFGKGELIGACYIQLVALATPSTVALESTKEPKETGKKRSKKAA